MLALGLAGGGRRGSATGTPSGRRAGPERRKSDRRTEERKKQRATCEILDGGRLQRGVVRDVSTSGLFVQTTLPVDIGNEVEVHITPNSEVSPIIFVRARVVRKLRVDRRLAALGSGGVGLRITAAPPAYYEAFDVPPPDETDMEIPLKRKPETGEANAPGKKASAPEPDPNFRVRVRRGSRSYWIAVAADSESDAVSQAEAKAGEGWDLLEIELIEDAVEGDT